MVEVRPQPVRRRLTKLFNKLLRQFFDLGIRRPGEVCGKAVAGSQFHPCGLRKCLRFVTASDCQGT